MIYEYPSWYLHNIQIGFNLISSTIYAIWVTLGQYNFSYATETLVNGIWKFYYSFTYTFFMDWIDRVGKC